MLALIAELPEENPTACTEVYASMLVCHFPICADAPLWLGWNL